MVSEKQRKAREKFVRMYAGKARISGKSAAKGKTKSKGGGKSATKPKTIRIKKQVSGWKNKSLTMPLKNGKPYKQGDKPPYTYKKYNYKVKLGKKNNKGIWAYDSVMLQKEPPSNHINEMIAAWSIFEVITPSARYSYYGKK